MTSAILLFFDESGGVQSWLSSYSTAESNAGLSLAPVSVISICSIFDLFVLYFDITTTTPIVLSTKKRDEQLNRHTTIQRNVNVSGRQVVIVALYTNSPSIKSYMSTLPSLNT
jgi:hypothetical protein